MQFHTNCKSIHTPNFIGCRNRVYINLEIMSILHSNMKLVHYLSVAMLRDRYWAYCACVPTLAKLRINRQIIHPIIAAQERQPSLSLMIPDALLTETMEVL